MQLLTFVCLPVLLSALCHSRLDLLETGESFSNLSVLSDFQCKTDRFLVCVFSDEAKLLPTPRFLVRSKQIRAVRVTDLVGVNQTLQESEDRGANATLLILPNSLKDRFPGISTSTLVIGLTEGEGNQLESVLTSLEGWSEAWLSLTLDLDCDLYQRLLYVWTVASIGWILLLAL